MSRTIKGATFKRFHYETHNHLRRHLASFVAAYNFGKRLKALMGLTPYEFICKCRTTSPTASQKTRTTKSRDHTFRLVSLGIDDPVWVMVTARFPKNLNWLLKTEKSRKLVASIMAHC